MNEHEEPRNDPANDQPQEAPPPPFKPSVAIEFFRELIIFLLGLLLGFFWYAYTNWASDRIEFHLIFGLIVIIVCMARFIFLSRMR